MERRSVFGTSTRRAFVIGSAATALLPTVALAKEDDEVSPTEDLMREHGVLRRVLLVYGDVARRIDERREVKAEWVASAATIVREFIEDYHEKDEEQYVFPRLQKTGKLDALVTVLVAQHQAGRRLTADVLRIATPGAMGGDASKRQLAASLRAFIYMYEPHASREDTVVFPMFRSLVRGRELKKLMDVFEDKEKALPHGGFEKMVAEVARIEHEMDLDDLSRFTPVSPP